MVHYCYLTLLLRKPQFNMFLQTANAIIITEFETIGFAGIRFGNTLDPQLVRMRLSCWLHMASGDADHWVKSVCGFSWCSTGFSTSASSICCFVCLVSSCVTFLSAWLVFKCVCVFFTSVCESAVGSSPCRVSFSESDRSSVLIPRIYSQ